MKRIASLIVLSLAFAAVPVQAFRKGKKLEVTGTGTVLPQKYLVGRFKKSPREDIMGEAKFVRSEKRVAVPFFRVSFKKNTKKSSKATSGGIPSEQVDATQTVMTSLEGVSDEALQRITDKAHQDLVIRLAEAGIPVVPQEEISALEGFDKLGGAYPDKGGSEDEFVAAGTRYTNPFGVPGATKLVLRDGKAATVWVDYSLNFVSYGTQQHIDTTEASAKVTFGQVAHVWGGLKIYGYERAKCNAIGCNIKDEGKIELGQAVYSQKPFGEFVASDSAGTKAGNLISGAASLLGGKSSRKKNEYTLKADEAKYEEAAVEALIEANKKLVAALS